MLQIEDREIERRMETTAIARALIATELRQAESELLLELTAELWEEIVAGPPRPEDLDRPLGLGVPPAASRPTLREFLAGSGASGVHP
jgi:hypothetical protein